MPRQPRLPSTVDQHGLKLGRVHAAGRRCSALVSLVEALVALVAALVADPEAAEALVISRGFSKPPTFLITSGAATPIDF